MCLLCFSVFLLRCRRRSRSKLKNLNLKKKSFGPLEEKKKKLFFLRSRYYYIILLYARIYLYFSRLNYYVLCFLENKNIVTLSVSFPSLPRRISSQKKKNFSRAPALY